MARITCPSCENIVPVRPPFYRCTVCDYPLNKNAADQNDVNINIDNEGSNSAGSQQDPGETQLPFEVQAEWQQKRGSSYSNPPPVQIEVKNNPNPDRKNTLVAGWLIVHTENKQPVSYELYHGDNFFGTPSDGYLVDIPIEEDRYVSRCHANIQISKDFLHRFHYVLLDNGSRRPQGPSTNGTFVNGNPNRLPSNSLVHLRDGDTVQIGETKLVFKNVQEVSDVDEAATQVLSSDFTKTVILSKP